MRIVYLGTPEFAIEPLKQLINHRHQIVLVVTQPPKAVGRGNTITKGAVELFCIKNNLDYRTPSKFKEVIEEITSLKPDLVVTCAYGKILNKSFVSSFECINIHPSLLPYERGASPMQYTIINNHPFGVTIFKMDEGMDTGDILIQKEVHLDRTSPFKQISKELSIASSNLIIELLNKYQYYSNHKIKQNNIPIVPTYSKLIKEEDLVLNPLDSYNTIINKLQVFGKLTIYTPNGILYLYKALFYNIIDSSQLGTLTISKNQILLKVVDGTLSLLELQLPGRKVLGVKDFLNGLKNKQNSFVIGEKNE
jgi:methionyl-tRNA formyltransferase